MPVQLLSANEHFDFGSVKEWLFITPLHQIGTLVAFLESQIALLPCIPDAKVSRKDPVTDTTG